MRPRPRARKLEARTAFVAMIVLLVVFKISIKFTYSITQNAELRGDQFSILRSALRTRLLIVSTAAESLHHLGDCGPKNNYVHSREDKEHHRDHHQDRSFVRLFLRSLAAAHSHLLALNTKHLRD